MASSEKRCHYEILGLNRDCTPEEIRSAYRKLALQRHPDKLIKTGIPEESATAAFQELVNAYEVLSDPKERSWYDSHRSQILFSDSKSSKSSGPVPDLFSFFSNSVFSGFGDAGKGFYKVYGDVFGRIYAQEVLFARKLGLGEESVKVAPLIGNLESEYVQVSAFYGYWLGFCTVMDFCWVDEYDVMAGPNRKSRRMMEDENKKVRKKARREYNETVRGLAEYAKKRDKRVIDMQLKKTIEMEKKREEEKARKKEAERLKMERARMYEEPDWAKVNEEEIEGVLEEEEDDGRKDTKELYCVFCSKKFKSDKQWKNHEQSKKHKERVAEFKDTLEEEDDEEEEEDDEEEEEEEVDELGDDANESDADFGPSTVENAVDELCEQFENDIGLQEKSGFENLSVEEEETVVSNADNGDEISESSETIEGINNLKETTSGRKNKKRSTRRQPKMYSNEPQVSAESEDMDLMECNSRRNTRKNRAAKKEAVRKCKEEVQVEVDGDSEQTIPNSDGSDVRHMDASGNEPDISHVSEEVDTDTKGKTMLDKPCKVTNQPVKKKDTGKGDTKSKIKDTEKVDTSSKARNAPKHKKQQRGESKKIDLSCQTCGVDFDSRNKLHKHLSDTGHASLKSR